jgi:transposase, IS30 family
MKKQYHQLNLEEREQLHLLIWDKLSLRKIAKIMSRSPATISREITRNTPPLQRRYTPHLAQEKYHARKIKVRQRPRLKDPILVAYVLEKLKLNWSPELIAGTWRKRHPKLPISHEAIYQYIYYSTNPGDPNDLRPYLRRKHKRRKRKYVLFKTTKTTIPERIGIELRPRIVDTRKQYGHWEGDVIESTREQATCLKTLVERKSRLLRMAKINQKTAEQSTLAAITLLAPYPCGLRRTLTQDNGTENAKHQTITQAIGVKCYFAHPYHSWERGTNEQTNGLIRQYFPKGTNFATIPESEIRRVEYLLNNRPRKVLNYCTPQEVFNRGVALTC